MANTSKGIHYPDKYSVIADVPEDMKEMAESINDLFEENDIKTKEQDATIQNNTESISELQKENAELKAENTLLKSQFPPGKESGEHITLKDSSNLTCKINIQGNTEQETRSGKNIFNNTYNNLAMWQTGIGQTTTFAEDTSYLGAYCKVEEGKTYSISKAKTTSRFVVAFCNEVPTVNSTALVQYRDDTALKIENITIPEGYSYLVLYLSNSSETFEGLNLQIEEGTVATDYEPYGAMPSPDYPSEIKNVTGSANITVCNKNLADLAIVNDQFRVSTEKINASTFKVTRNYAENGYGQVEMYLKANTTYTVYLFSNNSEAYISLWRNYNAGGYIQYSVYDKHTFTTTQEKLVIGLYPGAKGQIGDVTEFKIMIIEGDSTSEDYIEPQSQSIVFPLSEGQKLYKDSYLADDGIHHKRGQYQFTGNETLLTDLERTNTRRYYTNTKVVNAKSLVALSNRFVQADSAADLNNNDNEKILTLNGGQFAFRINKTTADGVTAVKQWLSENPLIVEYELAEEVKEPYTQEQQIAYNELQKVNSYKNVTHIFSTDEISPIFNVTYKKDLEALIGNIETELGGI